MKKVSYSDIIQYHYPSLSRCNSVQVVEQVQPAVRIKCRIITAEDVRAAKDKERQRTSLRVSSSSTFGVKDSWFEMQRCPYIHEMKERLLGEQMAMEPLTKELPPEPPHHAPEPPVMPPPVPQPQPVGTVVRLNADGYSSHTSPAHQRTPLMPREPEEEFQCVQQTSWRPKNAKTSLFIITSFIYAKLLVVICIAYVISDVVTHNLSLYYYEGFFTYLYGMSILFLLYVFCFLLQESTCCSGGEKEKKVKKPPPEKKDKKEKEKKEKEKKEKEKKEKDKKDEKKDKGKDKDEKKNKKQGQFQREVFPRKMRDLVQQRAAAPIHDVQSTYRRNSEGAVDAGVTPVVQSPVAVPVPVTELEARVDGGALTQEPVPPPQQDVEAAKVPQRKRKTTQNDHSHGSFFLRVGAIAFGLGTMIYNGLEFGSFFEVPFTSPCHQILRGVNPVLQMIFTFMQMYFIFMNSRLNIHRFKVIARFGLMHVVATNICVWIRTLVLEYLKEITAYHKRNITVEDQGVLGATTQRTYPTLAALRTTLPTTIPTTTTPTTTTTLPTTTTTLPTTTTTPLPTTTPYIPTSSETTESIFSTTPFRRFFEFDNYNNFDTSMAEDKLNGVVNGETSNNILGDAGDILTDAASSLADATGSFGEAAANTLTDTANSIMNNFTAILPQALTSSNDTDVSNALPQECIRINIMGTIVQDSAPYLFPFIIEYSLIGAAVIYVMWKHIGRNPRYVTEEDLEHRLEVMLSRRAVAMAHAQHGRVDCVGASKGLFFGLLLLVGSLICLILFFVLIRHPDLSILAIYLADASHCVLMVLSIVAIIIGFIRSQQLKSDLNCRVQNLKFRTEEQSDLNDILLRVSAFGLFIYAVFSVIAGSLAAFTHEPNLLVMITGLLSIVQVVLQLLFIADVSRRRVHLPEHDRSKPGRQVVTFLLICNVTMWIIYTFETQKVEANPVQLDFYGFMAWAIVQRVTLPLCIFHRFHSAVTLAEIWKTSYKARLE